MTEIISNVENVEMFLQEVGQLDTFLFGLQHLVDIVNVKKKGTVKV
jgi:hypothetical protein